MREACKHVLHTRLGNATKLMDQVRMPSKQGLLMLSLYMHPVRSGPNDKIRHACLQLWRAPAKVLAPSEDESSSSDDDDSEFTENEDTTHQIAEFLGLSLPALELLVDSDEFITCSEEIIVLLIDAWYVRNTHIGQQPPHDTDERLSNLVRFGQLATAFNCIMYKRSWWTGKHQMAGFRTFMVSLCFKLQVSLHALHTADWLTPHCCEVERIV